MAAEHRSIRVDSADWQAFERLRASLQERTPYRVRTGDVFRIAIDTTTRALAGEVHVAEGPPQPVTPVSMTATVIPAPVANF